MAWIQGIDTCNDFWKVNVCVGAVCEACISVFRLLGDVAITGEEKTETGSPTH